MKNIYLKAGKTQDVFNDLKDNFNGTLTSCNDEFNLEFASIFARGNIKGITFPDAMTLLQFDMIFHDDVRISMEALRTSPIFFAYCMEGNLQHSFGEQGKKKIIKKKQTAILKSNSSVNSIMHFEKHIPIKFYVIQIDTKSDLDNEQNDELVMKLKKTFFTIKEDYLDIRTQNFEIANKIQELNTITHKGIVRNLLINRILENILKLEIKQHTDGLSAIVQTINACTVKQIDEIKRVSDLAVNLSLELFTTDYIFQNAILFKNRLQKEFKMLFSSRSVHDFLIYMRIERERV